VHGNHRIPPVAFPCGGDACVAAALHRDERRGRPRPHKTSTAGVLAVAVLLALAACGRGRADGVGNGGFEDGLEGWKADGAAVVADLPRTGKACAGGPVGAKGWTLEQVRLPAEQGRTYRIDAWIRATGAATLSLWTEEGRKDATRAAVWDDVPAAWTVVSAYVTAAHNDKLSIRFEASGAEGGDASVFVDDVSVAQASLPAATQVEPGKGFDDEPSMARAADGSLYVAWISWRDGGDSLQAARFTAKADGTFEKLGAWQVAGGPGACVSNPRVTQDAIQTDPVSGFLRHEIKGRVGFDIERGGKSEYSVVALGANGPDTDGLPIPALTPDLGHNFALDPDDPGHSVATGETRDGWYVHTGISRGDSGGGGPISLSATPLRRPQFLRGGKWFLYENVETPGYRVSEETMRRVVVAKEERGKFLSPKNYAAASPLWQHAESATAAFDDKDRLWVAYLRPRLPTAGWEVWLTGWTGSAWVPPIPVSTRKGMNRRPGLVLDGNRAIVCFQADDRPDGWRDIDKTKDATSGVFLVSVPLPDASAVPHELEPLVANPAPWEAAEIRKRFGDDHPVKRETTVVGEKMTLLFGDLHSHSDASVCDRLQNGSADDVYAMQRDFLNLRFACLTDHAEDMHPYLWNRQAKLARANEVPGSFTTFLGFEWTSGYDPEKPKGTYGHRNVILGDLRFPKWWSPRGGQTPAQLWTELRAANANFVTIPHQLADTGNVPTDWSFTDEIAQPVAEIFQVRGSYEAPGEPRVGKKAKASEDHFLQGALKKGIVIGVIASPDHGGGVGKACVWAKENSREAILDALRARRTYGTTGARIALEVRVGGHFMGEKSADGASGPVTVEVKARCPNDVAKVSICRGGTWVHAETPTSREFEFTWTDNDAPAGRKWYYVRVEQKDGELAWSSPVWLGAR
jgi:hypothetical protein